MSQKPLFTSLLNRTNSKLEDKDFYFTNVPIQIIVISSLIGPVPYEFEHDEIPINYNLSVNKITKDQFNDIKPILIKRISGFINICSTSTTFDTASAHIAAETTDGA